MIRETHLAIRGDETIGVTGLARRVSKLEHKQRRMILNNAIAGGLIAGGIMGLKNAWLAIFK